MCGDFFENPLNALFNPGQRGHGAGHGRASPVLVVSHQRNIVGRFGQGAAVVAFAPVGLFGDHAHRDGEDQAFFCAEGASSRTNWV